MMRMMNWTKKVAIKKILIHMELKMMKMKNLEKEIKNQNRKVVRNQSLQIMKNSLIFLKKVLMKMEETKKKRNFNLKWLGKRDREIQSQLNLIHQNHINLFQDLQVKEIVIV
jgi:ribosome-binding ATPase YchF (GTP1/OBG family)